MKSRTAISCLLLAIAGLLMISFLIFSGLVVVATWYQNQVWVPTTSQPVPPGVIGDDPVQYFQVPLENLGSWFGAFLAIGGIGVIFALMVMAGLLTRATLPRRRAVSTKVMLLGLGGSSAFAALTLVMILVVGVYFLLSPSLQEQVTGQTYQVVPTLAPMRTLTSIGNLPPPALSVVVQPSLTPHVGQAGQPATPVVIAATLTPTTIPPTPTPTPPPWMVGEITHLKVVNTKTKAVIIDADVEVVDAYCFLGKDKYVAPGAGGPEASKQCPDGVVGEYRWDVPSNKGGVQRYNPGQSVIVLNGHKDSFQDLKGHVFANLYLVDANSELTLTTTNGEFKFTPILPQMLYDVTDGRLGAAVNGRDSPEYPAGTNLVTYTCGGKFQDGAYTQRRVVYWTIQPSK